MGQFDWTPDDYLERIRAEVPRYDELQEQAIAAIPFPPERVLELGMGTGETTRRLIEAYPDAWVVGLDSSPDMVFRARQTYDDVQLARIEDPLPDGPWDLVISVLSDRRAHRRAEARAVSAGPGAIAFAGDRRRFRARAAEERHRLVRRRACLAGRRPRGGPSCLLGHPLPSRDHGRPEEENFQCSPRQAARQPQGGEGAPQPVSALPQPAVAAPGLPDLRHLRGT